ncbi:MAG: ATP-binding cassette domain-containing protein [Acidobacteria bacterium]|jgi:lipopolysaccharide transport system ATP-binding protein|nr:MAG: ATP-binding cassette domain-containing protein [Acidobacteriota bacterium]GIU82834.1 MAG: ABC transporter [Pyrinomonadaceae bacterium]
MEVIRAENLSKLYYLGGLRHNSLRDTIASIFKKHKLDLHKQELWALRDVSFSVRDGETLGIIGNNGAGKSTLLKILSRITKPTSGRAEICGRVGSLLEIGTGFHSELSGRENIFLSGAILGMKRKEIEKKFDEIVAFAELERFIDVPVKHYSSGMYMRLAFSVAAHLEPEILIVDEVLAVGDMAFQKKCLNKMQDTNQSGRTVLFVSHDMLAITRICNRAILLSEGKIVKEGNATDVVSEYIASSSKISHEKIYDDLKSAPSSEYVRLRRVRIVNENRETCGSFDIRHPIGIEVTYEVLQDGHILLPNFQVYNQNRVHLFTIQDVSAEWRRKEKTKGEYVSTAWIPGNLMAEGSFLVNVAFVTYLPRQILHFNALEVVGFNVFDPMTGDTARGDYTGHMEGVVRPLVNWETHRKSISVKA